jgi:putative Holliday junction resolvase
MQLSESSQSEKGLSPKAPGRLLALDLGAKRVGVAVSDELQISTRPLAPIERRSWKDLLRRVAALVELHQAKVLVIGLPIRLDGTEGPAAKATRDLAQKFKRSLAVPVFLQNESLTSFDAQTHLKSTGQSAAAMAQQVDSEAAAIILRDFISEQQT